MTNAFNKGMLDASAREQDTIKKEIMAALNIKSRQAFNNRRHGKVKHTPADRIAIECVFHNHAVNQPWGEN